MTKHDEANAAPARALCAAARARLAMDPSLWADEDAGIDSSEDREAALREALIWAGAAPPEPPEPEPEPEDPNGGAAGPVDGQAGSGDALAAADIAERQAAMELATERHTERAAERAAQRAALREAKNAEANAREAKRLAYASERERLLSVLATDEAAAAEQLARDRADVSSAAALREQTESALDAEVQSSAEEFADQAAEREARKLAEHEASVVRRGEVLDEKRAAHTKTREEKLLEIDTRYGY